MPTCRMPARLPAMGIAGEGDDEGLVIQIASAIGTGGNQIAFIGTKLARGIPALLLEHNGSGPPEDSC